MIRLENINKYFFKNKKNQIHVIDDTTLELPEKGLVTLLGPSGSGKTTLLNVIGGLDTFESGTLTIDDLKLDKNNYRKIENIRNTDIGYVFQDYKLIDDMTVFENVALSLKMCGVKDKNEITKRVNDILEHLGIYRYRNRKSAMLSGGERQRVSIARALVKDPKIVICDEPTGNLDSKRTVEIMNILKAISNNRLVLLVSHEENIAKFYSDQIIEIKDGKIVANYKNEMNGDLDYEIANTIYLKDIKNHYNLKKKNVEIDVYNNDDNDVKINLVIRNNNIYIETNAAENVQIINENSAFEMVDEHYKGIDKETIDKLEFEIEPIKNKRKTSIFNLINMLKVGWSNIFKKNRLKKVTIICAALSAALVLYAGAVFEGAKEDHPEDYLFIDEAYYMVRTGSDNTYEVYKEFKKRDDFIHVQTASFTFYYRYPLDVYYQAASVNAVGGDSTMSSKKLITQDDLIYGELTDKPDEIVIDLNVYEGTFKNEVRLAGILDYKSMIGEKIYSMSDANHPYTITGIVNKKNNTTYFNEEEIRSLTVGTNNSFGDIFLYTDKIDIEIVAGTKPEKLKEIIIPDIYLGKYAIGDEFEQYKEKYTISGFFKTDISSLIYTNEDTIEYLQINNQALLVAPKDPEAFEKEFGNRYKMVNIAKDAYEVYDTERKSNILSATFTAAVFIIITLIFVVLMSKASFLSRIKEVGVLRSVGVSKMDIIRMFSGETIILLALGGTSGTLVMYYLLSLLEKVKFFDFRIAVNPTMAITCLLGLLIFYLIVVLIPVYLVIRKTPAQILSRKDV